MRFIRVEGRLAELPSLDFFLNFDGDSRLARKSSLEIPFGSIIYGDRENNIEILCLIEAAVLNDDSNISWKAVPVGIRANHGKFISREQYIPARVDPKSLESYFSGASAGIYDFVADTDLSHTSFDPLPAKGVAAQIQPAVIDELQKYGFESGKIIDISCGNGGLARMIRQRFPNAEIYGIDGRSKNVDEFGRSMGGGKAAVGYIDDLPSSLGQSAFDVIICTDLLEKRVIPYEDSAREMLTAAFHHLNPNGIFIATGHKPLRVGRMHMEDAGFDVLKTMNPENLFNYKNPKQMYVARKPVLQATH